MTSAAAGHIPEQTPQFLPDWMRDVCVSFCRQLPRTIVPNSKKDKANQQLGGGRTRDRTLDLSRVNHNL
jgi:hypothetical protein